MKKNLKAVSIIIIVAVVLAGATVTQMVLMFRLNTRQTIEIGSSKLDAISGELEETISDSKTAAMMLALEVQPYLDDMAELEKFIYKKKDELSAQTEGVCYNAYIACEDWAILPDFTPDDDYVVTKRSWYIGASQCDGAPYVSDPYVDAMSENVCYTVSVLLNDKHTVVALDYSMDNIQQHINQMYHSGSSDAVIVTADGIIAGCTDGTLAGKLLMDELPDYSSIFSLVKNSKDSVTANQRGDILFAARTGFGWYLIVCENSWSLYKSTYLQLIIMVFISLIIAGIIIVLSMMSIRSAKRAEDALAYKEDFLKRITSRLREPLNRINSSSDVRNVKYSTDLPQDMKNIREASNRLSEMIDELVSYSSIIRSDTVEEKSRKRKIKIDTNLRALILGALVISMGMCMYISVNAGIRSVKGQMQGSINRYGYQLGEWVNKEKNILDMFCSMVSSQPEMLDDYDRTVEFLDSITKQYPEISVSYMTDYKRDNKIYMNTGWTPDEGWHVEERDWYRQTMTTTEGWSVSLPYYDERTGYYCVTFSEKVYDSKTNEFLGIFGIDFYMDKLVNILGSSYTGGSYAFLVDASGDIINHPYGKYQMTTGSSRNIVELDYNDVEPDGDSIRLFRDYDDSYKLVAAVKNETSGFTVYYVSTISNAFGRIIIYMILSSIVLIAGAITVYKLMTGVMRMHDEANEKLRESADAAIAAGEAKSSFLAQMSHEIRTPINAVLGMNEMILRESDGDIREYALNIRSAGRTLLSLINSILDFSKIGDGKMEIISVEYDTANMIQSVVSAVKQRADDKGLKLIVMADNSLPSVMLGDDMRICQVISNLLTNAVKYTEKGSVTLTIKCSERNNKTAKIYVEIKDTGIGIREEDMDRLFESFRRLDEKRNRNIEGTGLGMSIVTKLLEMMNSKLDVKSVYGEGSTFSFTLEQGIVSKRDMGDYTKYRNDTNDYRTDNKYLYAPEADVLVVDDNEMNLKVASGLMKMHGIVPDTALSGAQGIEMIKQKHYDVIFLDHMMPGMDGIETLERIRNEKLIDESTAVIAMTANVFSGASDTYTQAGFDDYLGKPVESKLLESKLIRSIPDSKKQYKRKHSRSSEAEKNISEDSFTADELRDLNLLCPQLSIVTGMGYCMDSREFYIDTLKGFVESDRRDQLKKAFDKRDWESFRICVHGLKSSALTVGAMVISEHAKALEFAAKEGDYEFIDKIYGTLAMEYTQLLEGIGKVLKYEQDNGDR